MFQLHIKATCYLLLGVTLIVGYPVRCPSDGRLPSGEPAPDCLPGGVDVDAAHTGVATPEGSEVRYLTDYQWVCCCLFLALTFYLLRRAWKAAVAVTPGRVVYREAPARHLRQHLLRRGPAPWKRHRTVTYRQLLGRVVPELRDEKVLLRGESSEPHCRSDGRRLPKNGKVQFTKVWQFGNRGGDRQRVRQDSPSPGAVDPASRCNHRRLSSSSCSGSPRRISRQLSQHLRLHCDHWRLRGDGAVPSDLRVDLAALDGETIDPALLKSIFSYVAKHFKK